MTPNPIPSDVADRINKAIGRSSILDDSMITVSNQGSTVYLDGEASSYVARATAEDAAWNAPGVGVVVDRLSSPPEPKPAQRLREVRPTAPGRNGSRPHRSWASRDPATQWWRSLEECTRITALSRPTGRPSAPTKRRKR